MILDPLTLFVWAKKYCRETEICFSSKQDHKKTAKKLKSGFDAAKTVTGTLQYHSFIPTADGILQLRKFSSHTEFDFLTKDKKRTRRSKKTN